MSDESLASREYQDAMNRIVLAAQCIETEPLEKMHRTLEMCDSLGPVQYPSEYRAALHSGSIDAQRRTIQAARELVAAYRDLRAAFES